MRLSASPRASVARRIHLSFVIAAALPLFLLAASAYHLVSSRLEEVALKDARSLAKSLGMDTFDRLQFLNDQLKLIIDRGASDDAVRSGLEGFDLSERVRGFFHVGPDRTLTGALSLTGDERGTLHASLALVQHDKPALIAVGSPPRQRLLMLMPDGPGYLGAELSLQHLWDTAGVGARPERICVLDNATRPVYCNHPDYADWLAASGELIAERRDARALQFGNHERALTAAWSLFLKPHYQFERWTIVVGVPEEQAFVAITAFGRVFAGIALISVLIAFLLGRRMIRSNLEPLDSLSVATRHLAAGDFGYRVRLRTGDEFEQLGQAFDGMADRIGGQFRELGAMARLDRSLQSARSIEDALAAAAAGLAELVGTGRCAIVCHERWQQPGTVWLVPFAADRAERSDTVPRPDSLPDLVERAQALRPTATSWQAVVDSDPVAAVIVFDGEQHPAVARVSDVLGIALGKLASERHLSYQATHDWLSGLPTRGRLQEEFIAWTTPADPRIVVGMLLVGIDRFKQINDSVGHAMADRLLRAVADRLKALLPEDAMLGRFSGDQFMLMLAGDERETAMSRLEQLATRVASELDRPFSLGPRDLRLSASMGGALYPRDGDTFDDMLQCLDAAHYAAKRSRRGGMLMFSQGMRDRLVGRMDVEQALKGAVANNEMVLHYQPVVDAVSGRVRSAEALMRWQRPGIGLVMPGGFIEVAEESGLIAELGRWAVAEACRQIVEWQAAGIRLETLNVNVSSKQLADDAFLPAVQQALADSGIEPRALTLEVTESALIDNLEDGIERLKRLRALGVSIMIDDFGTGYASLKYLKLLPVDGLKIDRLFVKDLPGSARDEAIVTSVVSLSRASGFKLVAEGIETRDQSDILREHGVPYLQGFLFARGLPADRFVDFIRLGDAPARQAESL